MLVENRNVVSERRLSVGAYRSSAESISPWLSRTSLQHEAAQNPVKDWFANSAPVTLAGQILPGSSPDSNSLLALLHDEEWQRLAPYIEHVEMPQGSVLSEAGDLISYMYFPTTAVVSLSYVMENGASGEVAVIGNDGLVGMSLLMVSGSTPCRAVVQTAGQGFRLPGRIIKAEFNRGGRVLELFLKYMLALINQTSQLAICNRHHSVDQQLCRRLLQSLDLQDSNEILVTQERIAGMLGVRREGVTAAALSLQQAGLIRYARGRISILDRQGLEKRSCECYSAVRSEYARLMPATGSSAKSCGPTPARYRSVAPGIRFPTMAVA